MAGLIGLVGGDEFRQHCVGMDREILRAAGPASARVVVIPTAAVTNPVKAANDGVAHFAALGANAEPLPVLEPAQAQDPSLVRRVAEADVIYFTGGSPDHLLETLRGSHLLAALRERLEQGGLLVGSSAGAMVLGSRMRRPRGGPWVEGLGLAGGVVVLPHHEASDPDEAAARLPGRLSDRLTALGIDAQTGCLGQSGHWRVIGQGRVTVYRPEGWQVYRAGESFRAGIPAA